MKNLISLLVFSGILTTLFSCVHEPFTPVTPIVSNSKCDSDTVYFQNDILPLFLSSCAMSQCHDKTSHKEGVILTDYTTVISSGIINKNDPYSSDLYEKISDNGKNRMPPLPYPALTNAQINSIVKWMSQGAKNNQCNACDTSDIKFSTAVSLIIYNNCKGCHSGSTPSKNIKLESYSDIRALVDDGRLLNVINGQNYQQMPPSGKMEQCKIATITKWVNAGAQNN